RLFGSRIQEVRTLRASRENAYNILKPEIMRRREAEQNARDKGTEWKEKPDDYLEWARTRLDKNPSAEFRTVEFQARLQLNLSMAAIHTTSLTLTHIIYDLAANPQYIDELREEVKAVLETTGGKLTKLGMGKM